MDTAYKMKVLLVIVFVVCGSLIAGFLLGKYGEDFTKAAAFAAMCIQSNGSYAQGKCVCPKNYLWSGDGYCYMPVGPGSFITRKVDGVAKVKMQGEQNVEGEYKTSCHGDEQAFYRYYEIDLDGAVLKVNRYPNYCPPGVVCATDLKTAVRFTDALNEQFGGIYDYELKTEEMGREVDVRGELSGWVGRDKKTIQLDAHISCPGA